MNTPLAIAFIALLFSGCAVRVQQNRVCKAKIKQTKALLSELVPQDSIEGRVCMLRPMEDELRLVISDNDVCFSNRNIQEFLCDFEGYVNHKKTRTMALSTTRLRYGNVMPIVCAMDLSF